MSTVPSYLLSVYGPAERTEFGTYASQQAMLQAFPDTGGFNERLESDGHFVLADGLEPATTANTADGQGEKPALTDGPYLETKEYLGGFWVIEAADLDLALAVAGLARRFGDLDVAEEAKAEAFVAAAERWPREGVPRPAPARDRGPCAPQQHVGVGVLPQSRVGQARAGQLDGASGSFGRLNPRVDPGQLQAGLSTRQG